MEIKTLFALGIASISQQLLEIAKQAVEMEGAENAMEFISNFNKGDKKYFI